MKLTTLALVACALAIGASAGEPAYAPTTRQLPPALPGLPHALHVPRSQLGPQICDFSRQCGANAAGWNGSATPLLTAGCTPQSVDQH